jgi:hypothetical protein
VGHPRSATGNPDVLERNGTATAGAFSGVSLNCGELCRSASALSLCPSGRRRQLIKVDRTFQGSCGSRCFRRVPLIAGSTISRYAHHAAANGAQQNWRLHQGCQQVAVQTPGQSMSASRS